MEFRLKACDSAVVYEMLQM